MDGIEATGCHGVDWSPYRLASNRQGKFVGLTLCPRRRRFSSGYKSYDAHCDPAVAPVENASRSFVQVASRVSGRTRVSAVTVMKLVSPLQRGRAWRWMWSATPAPADSPRFKPRLRPSGR